MRFKNLLLLILVLLAFVPTTALRAETDHVRIEIIPSHTHPQPGETLSLIIRQTIAPGWHTYWVNPGDSGAAPTITWTLPEGFEAGEIQWAIPKRIPYAGLMNFGYEDTVSFLQDLYVPTALPEGPVTLKARIEILVCKDICIPEFKDISITLLDPDTEPVDNNDLLQSVFNDLPLSVDWTGVYHEEGGDLVVTLSSPTPGLFKNALEASFDLLPHEWGITRNAARPTIDSYADHRTLTLRIPRDSRALKEVETFDALLRYEMPDGTINGITVTLSPNPAASTTVPQPVETQAQISFGTAILFALLGGLILNLMPCVFPILSMKALSLVQLQDKDRSAARISGLAYTAGILVSFTALAGVILTLKGGGESLGWGFHLQNPVITLILAYLLFIIGLNLAGLFELGGRLAGVGASLTQKKGLSGSFFTGVLATIVATPCTAPFMAGALGFALVQPAPMALAVFSALGLGLALPYLAISCIPALTRLMPRPGSWMVRFKEFLSFPMFASAAWLVWVLAQQAGVNAVMWALSGMVALAFGLWMARYKPARLVPRFMAGLAAAIVFLFAAMPVIDPHILRTQNTDSAMVAPQDFSSELYQTLLDGDDPVFVYMTAAWCITCKVNERVAIDIPETHKIFKDKNIAVLRGDWTTMRADITLFLKNHGRNGVPLYVYHGPRDGATGKRPDPVILPQILTPAILRDTF